MAIDCNQAGAELKEHMGLNRIGLNVNEDVQKRSSVDVDADGLATEEENRTKGNHPCLSMKTNLAGWKNPTMVWDGEKKNWTATTDMIVWW